MSYLDNTGLAYLWQKIKDYVAAQIAAVGIETASTTVTMSNVGSGSHVISLHRQGNIVIATFSGTATASTANSAISVGTIPTGFRPTELIRESGSSVTNNSLSGYHRFAVATSGAVTFWSSVTTIREVNMDMMWWTEDAFPT